MNTLRLTFFALLVTGAAFWFLPLPAALAVCFALVIAMIFQALVDLEDLLKRIPEREEPYDYKLDWGREPIRAMPAVHAGNGAGSEVLRTKASGAVLGALAKGPLSRADLVRTLAQSLAGDADANAIIGLVVRDDFHKEQPWKYDGVTASL
jgi:hypothetical protein